MDQGCDISGNQRSLMNDRNRRISQETDSSLVPENQEAIRSETVASPSPVTWKVPDSSNLMSKWQFLTHDSSRADSSTFLYIVMATTRQRPNCDIITIRNLNMVQKKKGCIKHKNGHFPSQLRTNEGPSTIKCDLIKFNQTRICRSAPLSWSFGCIIISIFCELFLRFHCVCHVNSPVS